MGIAAIMQWLRLIEFLALLPDVGMVPRAMINTLRTVGLYIITLAIILVAFSTGFVVIYSSSTVQFDSYASAILTLWSALVGNVDPTEFIDTSYFTGIFLFFFFTFFTRKDFPPSFPPASVPDIHPTLINPIAVVRGLQPPFAGRCRPLSLSLSLSLACSLRLPQHAHRSHP